MAPGTLLTLVLAVVAVAASFGLGRALRARRPLMAFLLRRLGLVVITTWTVFTISFVLMRAVPGGPFDTEVALDPEIRARLLSHYGLDRPVAEQYLDTLANALRLDLGPSLKMRDYTVNDVLAEGFPLSAMLGVVALGLALLIGVPAGVIAAARRGRFADRVLMIGAVTGLALPNFVIAAALLVLFSFKTGWLPAAGLSTPRHLILPGVSLALPLAATIARLVRAGMLDQLGRDYVRTARAKGLSPLRVLMRHALPGALMPVVAYLGPAAAATLTGSLVIEAVFALPGLGSHFVQAGLNRDYPLAMGAVLVYTVLVCSINVGVDALHGVLDPRVKIA